ncbi:hypothetical protein [Maribacter sp. 4G9]|uniref:hypothetical protein n=1 Tax=Maribacter sp. 4G9 TaxID=1889777 RepID=UPI000C14A764|nr:hypothetical protein [Maribacter sp. 4G9]PIB28520.1 hypothetical protein BFP75_04535 [Maribacter sp. 4G9]
MNKLSVLLGTAILGVLLISAKANPNCVDTNHDPHKAKYNPFAEGLQIAMESANLDASEIVVLKIEEEVDLGFDTSQYLPLGFNAYEGMELDVKDIVVLEAEEEVHLGFDVSKYLPENFDAYAK